MRAGGRPEGLPYALVALMAAAACAQPPAPDPSRVTVALAVSPRDFDPRTGSDEVSQKIHQLVYNSLFRLDDRLRVVPDLATGYATPDDRTYVVPLREGVLFHDGHELTSADVVHTFSSFLDPAFVSARKGAYRLLASVQARDRYTVVFTLKEPFGSFPINLVMAIAPVGAGPSLAQHPVGTGPYRFVRYLTDDRVELTRFDGHFAGPARNSGLVLKVVPDDTMRGLELRKGTVDLVVNDLSPDIVGQLQREGRLKLLTAPGSDYAYIGINLRDRVLSDVRVRQALAHGIDRASIVKYLRRGLAEPALGVLPPASWAFEPGVRQFAYDPTRAARLLDEAGYPDPDGSGPAPRLRLSLKTSTAEFVRLQGAVIQQSLAGIGVAVEVRSYEFTTMYADVLRGNFQLFTLQWVGVSDPDMLRRVFHTKQIPPSGFNRGYYSNPEVDTLIDNATRSTDDEERGRLYAEVQQRVAADAPYISLWYKTNVAVFQPSLRGITLSPVADFLFLKEVFRVPAASGARAVR